MHIVLWTGHKLRQCPEGVLVRVKIHEEEGSDLGHALAVAHLRVEHAVGGQHVEQVLLATVVPLTEHHVISVCSVDIQVYLSDVRTVFSCQFLHFLILSRSNNIDHKDPRNLSGTPFHTLSTILSWYFEPMGNHLFFSFSIFNHFGSLLISLSNCFCCFSVL